MTNKKYGICISQLYKYGFKLALEVYEKYERKCSVCSNVNNLHIHHIDGKGKHFALRGGKPNNDIENLQLICRECHGSLHAKAYWAEQARLRGGYLWKDNKEYEKIRSRKNRLKHKNDQAYKDKVNAYRRDYYRRRKLR